MELAQYKVEREAAVKAERVAMLAFIQRILDKPENVKKGHECEELEVSGLPPAMFTSVLSVRFLASFRSFNRVLACVNARLTTAAFCFL